MGKVKNENFYTIQGWMVNELELKGNELMIYAIIYGFSQIDDQYFTGSQQYLADWTNTTKKSVRNSLQSLVDKGLLIKKDKIINNVKYCEYKALRESLGGEKSSLGGEKSSLGGEKSSLGGGEKSSLGGEKISPNNIENNITIYNKEDNKEDNGSIKTPSESKSQSQSTSSDVKQIVNYYNQYCSSFSKVRIVSDARKRKIKARLKQYSLDDFINMFEKAEASSFLKGKNNRNWKATFDWMIEDSHMCKILEGNYDDRNDFESKKNEWLDWAGNE